MIKGFGEVYWTSDNDTSYKMKETYVDVEIPIEGNIH